MRSTLTHPFGLTVLVVSVLIAGAMRFLTQLDRWEGMAIWVALWGLLGYGISAFAVSRWQPAPSGPELVSLQSIRQFIERELAERQEAHDTELTRTLTDALVLPPATHLDRHRPIERQARCEIGPFIAKLLSPRRRGKKRPPPGEPVPASRPPETWFSDD